MAERKSQIVGGFFETEREVRRLFRELIHQPWGRSSAESSGWQPSVDVCETDEALIIEIDLPGVTRKDVTVEVEGDVLRIGGVRRATITHRGRHYYQVERVTGRFARQLQLPRSVDREAIRARFRAGILTITLPKHHTESRPIARRGRES